MGIRLILIVFLKDTLWLWKTIFLTKNMEIFCLIKIILKKYVLALKMES